MGLYVAGPMRGIEKFNFPAFDLAADLLRACGHDVVTPADLNRAEGFDENAPPAEVTPEFLRAAIQRDVAAICKVDGLVLLPGWERSKGSAVEVALARFLGLRVSTLAAVVARKP